MPRRVIGPQGQRRVERLERLVHIRAGRVATLLQSQSQVIVQLGSALAQLDGSLAAGDRVSRAVRQAKGDSQIPVKRSARWLQSHGLPHALDRLLAAIRVVEQHQPELVPNLGRLRRGLEHLAIERFGLRELPRGEQLPSLAKNFAERCQVRASPLTCLAADWSHR